MVCSFCARLGTYIEIDGKRKVHRALAFSVMCDLPIIGAGLITTVGLTEGVVNDVLIGCIGKVQQHNPYGYEEYSNDKESGQHSSCSQYWLPGG